MPEVDLRMLRELQREAARALDERAALQASIAARSAKATALAADVARLEAAGEVGRAATLRARLEAERAQRAEEIDRRAALDPAWRAALDRLRGVVDPCDADPSVPLLLLPVRLETRYTDDRRSLRIRIFPDDVHVDALDPGLADTERKLGSAYWSAVFAAGDDAEARAAAWRSLVSAAGPARAAWVATALTPKNLPAAAPGVAPELPETPARMRRAAVARLLPDRFVAVALQGGQRSEATGQIIAPELVVGLLADDGDERVTIGGVSVPPGAEWLIEYERAVAAGMAITLPLARPGAGVDRLFVCGARTSLDPTRTADELESLLVSHRCGRGLAFLRQGAPTNNTESNRSAWQRRAEPSPPALEPPAADGNAAVLARALGIDPRVLAGLADADLPEQAEARAMHTALWAPTWGAFLERVGVVTKEGATLDDERREQTRAFHRDAVRARGPLPALRVGDQPYGILPVSATAEGRWRTARDDAFESALLPFLRRVRGVFAGSIGRSPRVTSGAPIDETLREILGTTPVCQGLRVRTVLSAELATTGAGIAGAITDADDVGRLIERLVLEEVVLNASFVRPIGSLEKKSRPLPLPLAHDSDPAYMDGLLAGRPPAEASVLQALLALAFDAAERALAKATPSELVVRLGEFATELPATVRERAVALSGVARTSSSSALHEVADAIALQAGEAGVARLAEHQPASRIQTSFGQLALESTVAEARAKNAAFALGAWYRGQARMAELREAIGRLRTTTTEARRILVGEALDLASHRVDAWITGIVERRRSALRAAKPAGLCVGAYGFVESITPGRGGPAEQRDGGYVHAPSLTHAATAGVLRSASLAHDPRNGGSGAFAIDLSSARVRIALELLDGVRQGQPLGALLGYRIERGLHEARLDRLVRTLRGLAPLVARRLTDRNEASGSEAQESIAANQVVDGLRLIERFQEGPAAQAAIFAALDALPRDNPYLDPADWPPLSPDERKTVQRIVADAAAAADAAADLLLAESVHQLVQGNTSAAAASLDALGGGDTAPPEPDVVRTPARSAPFTHRVLLLAPPPGNGPAGWNEARPRALAEPALERLAALRLGAASDVVVGLDAGGERVTLDAAGLAALDVVYDADDPARLEQRLRGALPALPLDAALAETRDDAWPAGARAIGEIAALAASLRALLVSAQPARPADLVRPNEAPTRSVSAAALEAAAARATAARGGLAARRDALEATLAAFEAGAASSAALRAELEALAAYGAVSPIAADESLLAVARLASDEAERRVAEADVELAAPLDAARVARAGQAIFGDGFWIVPAIDPPATPDAFAAALAPGAAVAPPRAEIRRFLRDVASVRDSVARFGECLLLGDALDRPTTLRVAQLATPGAAGAERWIGGALDPAQPTPSTAIASLVVDAPADLDPLAPLCALVVDGWIDVVPVRERRGEAADAPVDERRVTGLALNAATASARPPQALLLAISPDGARWTTDAVIATLDETLELAKLRTVTLERTLGAARVLPALYLQSHSLQGEKAIDLRFVNQIAALDATLRYVKEAP